ncbi:MAG: UDP-N-acetylglucosamine--N-acetylmuramyl-(pentapeptide) pyrophosphoryl-undecaprenol N-acetylglucosamine transferase [Alphaproteobacteria bacterium]|nr:UDP-N-acetylglucosamine--N-acetylmuramyl-(pentapeptide) pyrophosphoryl-undecaprenol N-acetylglucosamine transferase [Alphaproteobacteria bacterium]
MKMRGEEKLLLVAGGTGGHAFPCYAFYKYLKQQKVSTFVVTDFIQIFEDTASTYVQAMPRGKRNMTFIRSIIRLAKHQFSIIKKIDPTHTFLFGSVYCLPTFLALVAWRLKGHKCKIILHEQNIIMGKMNRLLQFFCSHIITSYQNTTGIFPTIKKKVTHAGFLVRPDFHKRKIPPQKKKTIVILGGSQGANFFASTHFLKFWYYLLSEKEQIGKVYHQVPGVFVSATQHLYRKLNINAQTDEFFDNIPLIMSEADVLISRAGGSVIGEALSCSIPTIFIPYRFARDQHQLLNAQHLTDQGAALLVEEKDMNPQALAQMVQNIWGKSKKSKSMRANMSKLCKKNTCALMHKLCKI